MTNSDLGFLEPDSIAIIGASNDSGKRGYQALRRLIGDGFAGGIYPIHHTEDKILGVRAYRSVLDVPGEIDLALICTPAKTLPRLIDECGKKGIGGAIVLGGGFSESGAEGAGYEAAMLKAARKYGLRLIGPNTSGIFNLHKKVNLAGIPGVKPGGLGLISQSGNMALSITTEARRGGMLGFSTYVGVGNQADVHFSEYLRFLAGDLNTVVAILYVEGFKQGRDFLDTAREVTQTKPVVVYKAGRTDTGRASAKSHTGSLAGSYEMSVDLLRQAGVSVALRSDHIVPLAETFSLVPVPKGGRVAVLADGGGHATIAADTLDELNIQLAQLSIETREKLAAILPPAASLANPVDVAGGTDNNPAVFADCVATFMEDDNVDLVLIVGLFGGYAVRFDERLAANENETAVRLAVLQHRYLKPVLVQSLYAGLQTAPLKTLRAGGVPVFESVEIAANCAAGVVRNARRRKRNAENLPHIVTEKPPTAQAIIDKCRAGGRAALFEYEAADLAASHGIKIPPNRVIRDPGELEEAARAFEGQAVVMKIVSRDILHKTEAGGVKLRIHGLDAMRRAHDEIIANAKTYRADAVIDGVTVAPMAEPGVEVIIGVVQDPIYGPVLMFGLGGVMVEVLKDVVFRSIPLSRADAGEMIEQIKAAPVLKGVRGAKPVDKDALVDLIMKVSALVHCHPEIAEIDFNPVFVRHDGYTVADARMILCKPEEGTASPSQP